jgi:hypothetical protein
VYIKWWKGRCNWGYCLPFRALSATMKTATLAGLAASLVAVVDAHGMEIEDMSSENAWNARLTS